MAKSKPNPNALDAEIPAGVSRAMLHELHLLTRDGQLNADARRKLKQIRHLVGLLGPALDDVYARFGAPNVVDCGAGKSYLGFLLYEMRLAAAGAGTLYAIEARPELAEAARARAAKFGYDRLRSVTGAIGRDGLPERVHLVTALHACDTATDDAIALGIELGADHIAVVPCCQAEVARQLAHSKGRGPSHELHRHPWHRREFGSHLTNVVRALALEAHGYQVTVTELAGWEHSLKNELILARRVGRQNLDAVRRLREVLDEYGISPHLTERLAQPAGPPTATSGSPAA